VFILVLRVRGLAVVPPHLSYRRLSPGEHHRGEREERDIEYSSQNFNWRCCVYRREAYFFPPRAFLTASMRFISPCDRQYFSTSSASFFMVEVSMMVLLRVPLK
jgi:hypothetical protein